MKSKKSKVQDFSPAEQRAARSERIKVFEIEPYGWMAQSEVGPELAYRLYVEPLSRCLVCTCADFIFHGNGEPGFECKHVTAVLKFIGRRYLASEYDPFRPRARAA